MAVKPQLTEYCRKNVGVVFQSYNLIPNLTVKENIETGAYLSNDPLPLDDMLKTLGLWEHKDKIPNQLSGGQQQRVAIARALVGEPSLILADEPTGNLDSRSGKEIMMLLHNLYEEGNTIVLITHDNNVAMEAPRQVQISDGKIIKDSGGEAEYEDHTSN